MDDANGVPHDDEIPTGEKSADSLPVAHTIGGILKQAREAKGLTLPQVAEQTKIRPGILQSIEQDDHATLPALTYTLGFVKAYARTVGVDPVEAGERYRQESHKGEPVPTMVDLQPLEEKRLPTRPILLWSVIGLIVFIGLFWAWGAGVFDSNTTEEVEPSINVVAEEPSEESPVATEELAPLPDATAPVSLSAKEEVWVRIADEQETFFMGTMTTGQTIALPANRNWTLRTGKAGALDVKVGNSAIPALGGPVEQVRGLSLKPDDLLARIKQGAPVAPPQTTGTAGQPVTLTPAPAR